MSQAPGSDRSRAIESMDAAIADDMVGVHARLGRTAVFGLCGPQGSGKSSTAARLLERLRAHGLKTIVRSLDDFYLTRSSREALARTVHPLLVTRGVPGTHDLALLDETLGRLAAAADGEVVALPTFDKTTDDRAPEKSWPRCAGPHDVILLEGWCVGARPQPTSALAAPVNQLEALEDRDGAWRGYVNAQLAGPYAALSARLDRRYLLSAPSFDCVFAWRAEQEAKLDRPTDGSRPPMDRDELRRFIAHYERITRWLMEDEPADLVIDLDEDRVPLTLRWT